MKIQDKINLRFWGLHGTLPVPGKETVKYGGNTSCVSVEFPTGNIFIFDGGTGIKKLSDHLMAHNKGRVDAKIFISHPHWDHINAIPFFMPLYMQGNTFEICGPPQGEITINQLISRQMDGVYFPIKFKEFRADIHFRDLKEEDFNIDKINIKTIRLNHQGYCIGYRVTYKKRSVSYITDNELYPKSNQFYDEKYLSRLADFVRNTDALITDSTYTEEEYETKIGWGHSSVKQVVELADRAAVKTLYLYHHDPDHNDKIIEQKLKTAREILEMKKSSTICIAPKEKDVFKI
jgi:phosphoribosyl 1,2-cyclic phosphodiesterase